MRVLSLFDGISCGMLALQRAGINIEKYYASEIEESAIKISKKNFPQIIQMGDVRNINESALDFSEIDLVIGGSPCQSLSNANVFLEEDEKGIIGRGKSILFWEFARILKIAKKANPDVKFLLENVGSASNQDKRIIDEELGVKGIQFNSDLVSAQNRNRFYWTNIPFEVPKQRKQIFMKDILEKEVSEKYYLSEKMVEYIFNDKTGGWRCGNMDIDLEIARPLTATMHKMHRASTDNYVSTEFAPKGKTNIRRLTPLECERLQTIPDHYTEGISDTARYKAIGNGWTVDVIAWIFRGLEDSK